MGSVCNATAERAEHRGCRDGMKLRALGEEGIGNKGMGMADVLGVGVSSRGKCG